MQKTLSTILIIFVAFVFSSLVYLLIGFILSKSHWQAVLHSSGVVEVLFAAFIVVSVVLMGVVVKLKQSAFSQDMPRPASLEQLQRYAVSRSIVLFALSEIPAIFGLVYFLLAGKFYHMVLFCVLSLFCFAFVRPSQAALEELQHRYGFQ